jgi:hypothetical protein
MPMHRELTEEELNMLEKGGGVKEETKKERERLLDGLEIFIQEKEKQTIEDLLLSEDGRAKFSSLWSLFFWSLDVNTEREVKKPKAGYAKKIKSALKCIIQTR